MKVYVTMVNVVTVIVKSYFLDVVEFLDPHL